MSQIPKEHQQRDMLTSSGMSNRTVLTWGGLGVRAIWDGLGGRALWGGLGGCRGLRHISRQNCTLNCASTTPSLSTTGYTLQISKHQLHVCVSVCMYMWTTHPSKEFWVARSVVLETVAVPIRREESDTRPSPTSNTRGCISDTCRQAHDSKQQHAHSPTPPRAYTHTHTIPQALTMQVSDKLGM